MQQDTDTIYLELSKNLYNNGSGIFASSRNVDIYSKKIDIKDIGSGLYSGNIELSGGYIQSHNFETSSEGWKLNSDGSVEFNSILLDMGGAGINNVNYVSGTSGGFDFNEAGGIQISATLNMNSHAIENTDYVSGSSGGIDFNTPGRIEVSTYFDPPDGGTYNLGGADRYWGDISYKTLTDRGCLGWYDEGVELQDGRIVSDLDALKEIKPHPTRKTPAGRTRLDYSTLPKDVYVTPKRHNGTVFPQDPETGEWYSEEFDRKSGKIKRIPAQEGAETTALISIILGAVKELSAKQELIISDIATLKNKYKEV